MGDVRVDRDSVNAGDVGVTEKRDQPAGDDRPVIGDRRRLQVASWQVVAREPLGERGESDPTGLPPLLALDLLEPLPEFPLSLRVVPLWRASEPFSALAAVVIAPLDGERDPVLALSLDDCSAASHRCPSSQREAGHGDRGRRPRLRSLRTSQSACLYSRITIAGASRDHRTIREVSQRLPSAIR